MYKLFRDNSLAELRANYEIKRVDQDNDLFKFKERLREESRKFDKKYKAAMREQADRHNYIKELQATCRYLNRKIVNGNATADEREYCKCLMEMQIMAFKEGFSFTQSLCVIYSGKDSD